MFWSKGKARHFVTDDEVLTMNKATYDYLKGVVAQNKALEKELEAIKPILMDPNIEPAKSKDCSECNFAVFGPKYYVNHNNTVTVGNQLLGCRRHGLCEDFKPREEE